MEREIGWVLVEFNQASHLPDISDLYDEKGDALEDLEKAKQRTARHGPAGASPARRCHH